MTDVRFLIKDIHHLLNHGTDKVDDNHIEEFFTSLRDDINIFLSPEKRQNSGRLRMSSIGKHDRKLWYEFRDTTSQDIDPQLKLKFFFGNLVEAFLLFLAQVSGHKVTDRQKEIDIEGIKGHIDAKIDGTVVDVKSASDFGFKKFKENRLHADDPFGYVGQLSGYVQAEGGDTGYFLAYNKNTAELVLTELDELTMINATDRIKDLKVTVKDDKIPERCYPDKPEGKQGNRVVDRNCHFCNYKFECWADANGGDGLRVFRYSSGPLYFTEVVKEPRVEEIVA